MIFRTLLVLLILSQYANPARLQFSAFPLKSESRTEIYDWIGYSLPEIVGRKGLTIEGVKVWDPIFLNQQDSSFMVMDSDSTVFVHRNRWQWDVLLGGSYRADQDSVHINLEIIWIDGKDDPVKMEMRQSARVEKLEDLLAALMVRTLSLTKVIFSSDDSTRIFEPIGVSTAAYHTYIAGYGMEMQGDYDGAITAYHRAIELDEHFDLALCRLGRLYLSSEKYEQARTIFKVLENRVDDPLTAADVANYYVESQQHERGKKFIVSHRQLLEMSALGLKAIGKMFITEGEYQRAVAMLTKAVAAGASDLDVDLHLGLAYMSTGDYNRSTDIFNRLIRFRPDYPRFYSCLGAAHRKAGRLMESCRVLEAALKIEPNNSTILNDLAITFIELKWYQKAVQLLLQALEDSPQLHDVYINLGVAYWNAGEKAEAAKWLNKARPYPHLRQSVYVNYANMLYSEGKIRSAIRMYHKARKNGKMCITVYHNLAQAYEASGRFKKAYLNYKECLGLSPSHTGFLLKLAIISEKIQLYSEAEYYYQRVLEISPYHKPAINGLVQLLTKENKLEEAVKPIESYLLYIPSDKTFMLQLGEMYLNMRWYEVAVIKYQAVIKDFPEEADGHYGVGKSIFEMKKSKGSGSYEDAIYALKQAAGLAPQNPGPDILIGDIYMHYKGYRELALDHWKKALPWVKNVEERKELQEKIKKAGM